VNRYVSAAAFKQAVENRLRSASASGADFARRRQLLVFDRFLARIVREFGDATMLKGGLVVELRVNRARTTKDIDLRVVGAPTALLAPSPGGSARAWRSQGVLGGAGRRTPPKSRTRAWSTKVSGIA